MTAPSRRPRLAKRCPSCGRELVERTNRHTGNRFLGCSGWPTECRHTEPLPEYVRLLAAGATQLPGFDDDTPDAPASPEATA